MVILLMVAATFVLINKSVYNIVLSCGNDIISFYLVEMKLFL